MKQFFHSVGIFTFGGNEAELVATNDKIMKSWAYLRNSLSGDGKPFQLLTQYCILYGLDGHTKRGNTYPNDRGNFFTISIMLLPNMSNAYRFVMTRLCYRTLQRICQQNTDKIPLNKLANVACALSNYILMNVPQKGKLEFVSKMDIVCNATRVILKFLRQQIIFNRRNV
ncbi:hypothetical protein RFI_31615 [Reticulomyxa filosa]|uniref:Uncharacterized protein n=1 Tax=Reticulomyxa filosa TaxID=46433 RepID=X6LVY5_RETFI|nr:hypothetical protein RFI_31615 [Reticulomyxa filosa]|eukprot:ETO05784.1 hypothetical protein RFI_31615 [Reticulomyxa filosa]